MEPDPDYKCEIKGIRESESLIKVDNLVKSGGKKRNRKKGLGTFAISQL